MTPITPQPFDGFIILFDCQYFLKQSLPTLITPTGVNVHGACAIARLSDGKVQGVQKDDVGWIMRQLKLLIVEE